MYIHWVLFILLPVLNPPYLVAHKARVNWSRIRIVLRMELLSSEWNYCPQPARIVPDYWIESPSQFKLCSMSTNNKCNCCTYSEIEMVCHEPVYWVRTETWIPLSLELKSRMWGINRSRSSQVCWGPFLFALHNKTGQLPSQTFDLHMHNSIFKSLLVKKVVDLLRSIHNCYILGVKSCARERLLNVPFCTK